MSHGNPKLQSPQNLTMDVALGLANKIILIISGDKEMTLFSVQRAFLNVLGFNWFAGGVNLPLPAFIKHIFYPLLCPTWMVTVTILILIHDFSSDVVTQNDFIFKINGYIVSMTFCAASFKSMMFFTQKKAFKELFNMVEELGTLDMDAASTKIHFYNCYLYITLVLTNPCTWALWSLLAHNDLPFKTQYPWDDNGVTFLFSTFFGLFAAIFCGLCHILVDTSFMMTVAGIILQVEILSDSLSRLGKHRFKDSKILSAAIEKHAQLLKVSQHLSRCYSNLFVAQSVYTVGHSCVLLFGAVHVESKAEVVMNQGTMLMTSYSQLLVYCYYGELLTSKFSGLVFDSYNNAWYDSELKVKKALPKFSLMCHRQSVQESVSYFLFLKTISGEE